MKMKPIRSEDDHYRALNAVAHLLSHPPKIGTPEGDFLEVTCLLIEDYERKNFPIDHPNPIEAIKFRMEQQGLTVEDLEQAIGCSTLVREVLDGTSQLTLPMIRNLHQQFKIPLESLVGIQSE